jgi:hypothetical protein
MEFLLDPEGSTQVEFQNTKSKALIHNCKIKYHKCNIIKPLFLDRKDQEKLN